MRCTAGILLLLFGHFGFCQKTTDLNKDFQKATKFYQQMKYEKSLSEIEDLKAKSDYPVSATLMLEGNAYYALEDFERAKLSYFEAVTSMDIDDPNRDQAQRFLKRTTDRLKEIEAAAEQKRISAEKKEKSKDISREPIDKSQFEVFEQLPVFPGCGFSMENSVLKKCMVSSMNQIIRDNFNQNLRKESGLKEAVTVRCVFKITDQGNLEIVSVNGVYPAYELEAIRILKGFPQVKPAIQMDKPVTIIYGLPIVI